MKPMLEELIKFFGGGVLILAAFAWLLKALITHSLSKEVESYRAILSKDIETHRAILNTQSLRLSRLHQKRGLILEQLYGNLIDFIKAVDSFVEIWGNSDDPTKTKEREKFVEAFWRFRDHFDKKRIFFSDDLCEKIDEFVQGLFNPASVYYAFLLMEKKDSDDGLSKDTRQAWTDAHKHMRDWTPLAKQAIENEFRSILGVPFSPTTVVDDDTI